MSRVLGWPLALGALLLVLAAPSHAAEQVVTDPDDAYAFAPSQSDVRAVELRTEGPEVTVTVRMENSGQFAAFTWFDADRNGRADYALVVDGGSGAATFDAELYAVPSSTLTCALYDPGTAPLLDVQPKVVLDPDGLAVLTVDFPATLIGGAGAWTWAAFGYTFNGMNPPGWDYVPDGSNPDEKVPQPASRDCSIDQVAGAGIRVDLLAGMQFPTPAPSNTPPSAAFGFAPADPLSTDPVTFTSTSTDPDGTLVRQRWDLDDDGQYDDAVGTSATTSFARKGPHRVGLLVEDDDGALATASREVLVGNRSPAASFEQVNTPVRAGQEVQVRSTSTDDGSIVGYQWDTDNDFQYDDASGPYAVAPYRFKGTWPVGLRVVDDDGAVAEHRGTVVISNSPPTARLRATPASVRVGELVELYATDTTDPDSGDVDRLRYEFDRGDGEFVRRHTRYEAFRPASAGRLTVRVRVTDPDGEVSIAEQQVQATLPDLSFSLFGPDPAAVVLADGVEVYGRYQAAGAARLCVALGSHATPPPGCDHSSGLAPDGSWVAPVSGLLPGINRITAFLTDRFGQVRRLETTVERVSSTSGLDLRAGAIEVTQGSQFLTLPNPRDRTPGAERVADYNGVLLARGATTYVRVFANARSLARGNLLPRNVTVTLTGYSGSTPLPGGPLTPIAGPSALQPGPTIQADPGQRANPSGGYVFQLPDAWSRVAHLRLDATVDPARAFPECPTCRRDNTFSLREIVFRDAPRAVIAPVPMAWIPATGRAVVAPPDANVVFDALRRLSPGGPAATTLLPFSGQPLNISDIANSTMSDDDKNWRVFDRAVRWADGSHTAGAYPVGVNTGVARGLAAPALLVNPPRTLLVMAVESSRPLTSVAHEMFHAYGAGHASTCTNGSDPRGFMGSGIDDWPTDQRGQLNGYALDLRPGSGGRQGPFRILPPTNYDFMSYCANTRGDPDSWLSARNWNRRMRGPLDQPFRTAGAASRARVARASGEGTAMLVAGAIDTQGKATILRVEPTTAPASAPAKDATFAVIVRGAGGAVFSTTPVAPPEMHAHEKPGEGGRYFRAVVPAPADPASVAIADSTGAVLATRTASAAAPTLRLARPSLGRAALLVDWQAADADGDELVAMVELAPDGSRFRPVALDLRRTASAQIPLAGLPGGPRARVRVTVSDGVRAASVTSAPFSLPTAASAVRILDPSPKSLLLSDQAITLRGEAIAPAGKRLAVRWFAGKRRLGRGGALTVRGLPAGRVRLRLVAADGASASRVVRVRAAAPVLTVLRVPKRVSRSARRVTLRVAASLPAKLSLGGRRYAIGRRVRSIRVRTGRADALRGRLVAGGKASRVTVALR